MRSSTPVKRRFSAKADKSVARPGSKHHPSLYGRRFKRLGPETGATGAVLKTEGGLFKDEDFDDDIPF